MHLLWILSLVYMDGKQALVEGIAENLDTTFHTSMSEYLPLIKDFFFMVMN